MPDRRRFINYLLLHLPLAFLTHRGTTSALSTSVLTVLKERELLDSIERHFYLEFYPGLTEKISGHLYDHGRLDDLQTNCSQELLRFWKELDYGKQAAYLDSFGKVGAGILTGNVVYLGYYDQCIDIGNTEYCRFPFDVMLTTNTTLSSNTSATMIPFEFGMCFPSSCTAKDFYDLFSINSDELFYSESFTDVNTMTYTINVMAPTEYKEPLCPWRDLEWTNSSVIVLTVCVLLIALVITGTMIDVSLWFSNDILPKFSLPEIARETKLSINEDEPLINVKPKQKASQSVAENRCVEFVKDLMLSFSLYKTVSAIMATHQPANAITSINGIRVISVLWVILGHIFTYFSGKYNMVLLQTSKKYTQ